MIFDILENGHRYFALHNGFVKAFTFLSRLDLIDLAPGKYDIDGDAIYAIVAKEPGRRKEEALLETHNRYIDIQLVLAGVDTMGWRAKSSCHLAAGSYDQEGDIQFFNDKPHAWFATHPGSFAIFFPEDAHLPLVSSGELHKVVVKIAVSRSSKI